MDDPDIEKVLKEYAEKYPPLITVELAAAIAHAPIATIHSWSSTGRLDDFKRKTGRRILFQRDAFVRFVLAGNNQKHSRETKEANV